MTKLRLVLTTLPVLWFPLISFREFTVAALILLVVSIQSTLRSRLYSTGGTLCWVAMNAALLAILYIPILEAARATWMVSLILVLLSLAILVIAQTHSLKSKKRGGWAPWVFGLSILIPIAIGGVPTFLLLFSPEGPPAEMIPLVGWITSIWTVAFWGALGLLFLSGDSMEDPKTHFVALILIVLIGATLVYRSREIERELNHLTEASSSDVEAWESLLNKTRSLQVPGQMNRVLASALSSPTFQEDDAVWVSWAKELDRDDAGAIDGFPVRHRILAIGGKPWGEGREADSEMFVAIEIDPSSLDVHLLTQSGTLYRMGPEIIRRTIEADVGPFVHMCLSDRGEPILLESGGRVVSVSDEEEIEIMPTHFSQEAAFLIRIAKDPLDGTLWVVDQFGVLYRSDPVSRSWMRDERFIPFAKTPDGKYPTAQDIALSGNGTIYFLNCYGEVWSSSTESQTVEGPVRGVHYFPDFPVAQSLGIDGGRIEIVDRYGGFYPSPYPTEPGDLQYRNSYLFPRSLPRRDPEIVDHVYLSEHRWLYLLTKSGRILTNRKWNSYWAR